MTSSLDLSRPFVKVWGKISSENSFWYSEAISYSDGITTIIVSDSSEHIRCLANGDLRNQYEENDYVLIEGVKSLSEKSKEEIMTI